MINSRSLCRRVLAATEEVGVGSQTDNPKLSVRGDAKEAETKKLHEFSEDAIVRVFRRNQAAKTPKRRPTYLGHTAATGNIKQNDTGARLMGKVDEKYSTTAIHNAGLSSEFTQG